MACQVDVQVRPFSSLPSVLLLTLVFALAGRGRDRRSTTWHSRLMERIF